MTWANMEYLQGLPMELFGYVVWLGHEKFSCTARSLREMSVILDRSGYPGNPFIAGR